MEKNYNSFADDEDKQKEKSRDLTTLEYLKILQHEWWICNLRRKIYPTMSDKRYFDKVANLKRDRIKEIADLNQIPCIFSDHQMMRELNKSFMKFGGMPVFDGIKEIDIINYYLPGNDVRCFYGFDVDNKPKIKIGKIKSFNLQIKHVEVLFDDKSIEHLQITKVSRIV
jgi:hypothetical protein